MFYILLNSFANVKKMLHFYPPLLLKMHKTPKFADWRGNL